LNSVLLIALLLLSTGLLMMTSASVEIANSSAGDPLYYFKRQAIFACVGIVAGTVTVAIPLALWRRLAPMLMLVSFVLLIAVLIPGIGHTVNGSARWIPLPFLICSLPSWLSCSSLCTWPTTCSATAKR
jgi:cell division protein FtsW